MRIAVTGAHGTGKTTLIDDFVAVYRDYESVPEAYWLLELGGMPFANGATTSDLEYQLVESCKLVLAHTGERDVIFDRCPLDFLAYLDVISASEGFEWLPSGRQLANVSKALASLDMVVFVPLISPDDIPVQIERPPVPEPRRLAPQVYAPRRRSGAAARRTPHSRGSGSRAQRVQSMATILGST